MTKGSSTSKTSPSGKTGKVFNYLYPVGCILFITESEWPEWAIPMDGQLIRAVDYPQLFKVVSYAYGGKDGLFRLPNRAGLYNAIVIKKHTKRTWLREFRTMLAWILISWVLRLIPGDDPDFEIYVKHFGTLAKETT